MSKTLPELLALHDELKDALEACFKANIDQGRRLRAIYSDIRELIHLTDLNDYQSLRFKAALVQLNNWTKEIE